MHSPPPRKMRRWFAPVAAALLALIVAGALYAGAQKPGAEPAQAQDLCARASGATLASLIQAGVCSASANATPTLVAPGPQFALSPPSVQTAVNTGVSGQVAVAWNAADGANKYRVGWLNHQDYLAAGDDWLQRFTFADVPSGVRQYRVTRLSPGEEYWFIVASVDAGNRMYWPQDWIPKFAVSGTPCSGDGGSDAPGRPGGGSSPTATPAPTRACPSTGGALSPGTKRSLGSVADWNGFRFGARSVTTPTRVSFGSLGSRAAPAGRKWLRVDVLIQNGTNDAVRLYATDFILETDAGVGYGWYPDATLPSRSQYDGRNMLWDIPAGARSAVLHIRPWITRGAAYTPGVMWQINVPQ